MIDINSRLYQDILDEAYPPSIADQFYQQTKFLEPVVAPPHASWPASWKIIGFKGYPRLSRIVLPRPKESAKTKSFFELVSHRETCRYLATEPLSLIDISTLLHYSVGIQDRTNRTQEFSRRMYPSGGARYPVEVYLLVNVSGELPEGVYHYHFQTHTLEVIKKSAIQADLRECYGDLWVQEAPYQLCLSAVFYRNEVKYQARGRRLAFLEAGHISQNVYLTTSALGLGCSALGGFVEDRIHQLLGLDGEQEGIIHAVAFGVPSTKKDD